MVACFKEEQREESGFFGWNPCVENNNVRFKQSDGNLKRLRFGVISVFGNGPPPPAPPDPSAVASWVRVQQAVLPIMLEADRRGTEIVKANGECCVICRDSPLTAACRVLDEEITPHLNAVLTPVGLVATCVLERYLVGKDRHDEIIFIFINQIAQRSSVLPPRGSLMPPGECATSSLH
jgi:hypothetical protein